MRILVVTPLVPPEPGGPSYLSVGVRDALGRLGHEVHLIAFNEVRKYPSIVRHLIFMYKVMFRAYNRDAVFVLDTVSVAIPAVLACWLLGKKTVVRTGGDFVWEAYVERTKEKVLFKDFYGSRRALSKKEHTVLFFQKQVVLRLASHITYNTKLQRDVWHAVFGVANERSSVLENIYPASSKKAQGGSNFVCAWRPTAFKNIDTLETALMLAREQGKDVSVDFLRGVPQEEVHVRLSTARALIIPSLTEFGPNLALEALSMGVPVLLTKECGMYEALDGYVTWIDPLDAKDMAEKIIALLEEAEYARERAKVHTFARVRTYDDVARDLMRLV